MTTIVTGQFVTISSVQVGGNMSVGADARISGNTTITGNLLVGGGLVYNGATMCANGITLSGDINVIGINGIDVTANAGTNTLTISGGGGGGSGFPNPANGDLNMNNFGILNVSGITVGLAGTDGYLTITDGTPVTTFNVSGAEGGAISNTNTSLNTIGGVQLQQSTVTCGNPVTAGNLVITNGGLAPTTTFQVQGLTGTVTAFGSITAGSAGTPSFVACSTGSAFGTVEPGIGYTGSNAGYSPNTAQIGSFGMPIVYFTGTVPAITPPSSDANMTFNYLQAAGADFAVGIFTYREITGTPENSGISCLYQKSGTNTYLTANYASGGGVGYPGYVSIDTNGTITLLSQNGGATYVASFVSFYLFA